jgi:hypothetical protein
MTNYKPLNDFDFEVETTWTFHENYDDLGACLYDGIVIIPVLKATKDVLEKCPKAVKWYQDFMDSPF